jgi:hypothetical protein
MITLDCQTGVAAHRSIQRSIWSARPQITGAKEFTPNPARITRLTGLPVQSRDAARPASGCRSLVPFIAVPIDRIR